MVQNDIISSTIVDFLQNLQEIISYIFYENFTFSSMQTVNVFLMIYSVPEIQNPYKIHGLTPKKESCLNCYKT